MRVANVKFFKMLIDLAHNKMSQCHDISAESRVLFCGDISSNLPTYFREIVDSL